MEVRTSSKCPHGCHPSPGSFQRSSSDSRVSPDKERTGKAPGMLSHSPPIRGVEEPYDFALRDIQLRLSHWGPPCHNMGLCSRPGEDPNAWKQFGPKQTRTIEPRYRPPGRRWILAAVLKGAQFCVLQNKHSSSSDVESMPGVGGGGRGGGVWILAVFRNWV